MDFFDVVHNFMTEDLRGHSFRVAKYTALLYRYSGEQERLGYSEDLVYHCTSYHDMGKLFVPRNILSKPQQLTQDEWDAVHAHPASGSRILTEFAASPLTPAEDQESYKLAAIIAQQHHERWDGEGYRKSAEHTVHPLARMCAIADSFDAMTIDRPYRRALSLDDAFYEIIKGAGSQFDPRYAECFVEHREDVIAIWRGSTQLFPPIKCTPDQEIQEDFQSEVKEESQPKSKDVLDQEITTTESISPVQ